MPLEPTERSSGAPLSGPAQGRGLAGSYLGQFELIQILGEGSSAIVYEGLDHANGSRVAVKVLKNARQLSAVDRDRFMDELRISRPLYHPNLAVARSGGIARGYPYLVMRLASRGSLQDILDQGRLSWRESLDVVSQVGSALDALHERGLVHRDVKPGNVLVDQVEGSTRYLLTDMGIIQPLGRNVISHPGTIGYSSPEQMRGHLVDRRADVFSLACLAHACLTGSPPWVRATAEETRLAVLKDPVPSVRSLRPELPEAVQGVLERALSKSQVDRHRSTTAFVQALEGASDGSVARITSERLELNLPTLRRSRVWMIVTFLVGLFSTSAAALGFAWAEPTLVGSGLLGLSAAVFLFFRPRHYARLDVFVPPQELLESVAIDLRRTPGWTSRPSHQGEVIVESEPGTPCLVHLLPLALLGILPAVSALLAIRRRSRIRVKEATANGGIEIDVTVTLYIVTTGLQARDRVESLLMNRASQAGKNALT